MRVTIDEQRAHDLPAHPQDNGWHAQKWLTPANWTQILNQLAILFADRFPPR
jgi:hypothetical protein